MAYLSCLPDPQIMTGEDCRHINAVMERLSAAYHIKVEAEPAYFKIYKTPENCRKYTLHTEVKDCDNNGLTDRERDMIMESCNNEQEKQLMRKCLYSYGECGILTRTSF